jgi:hypothetical protein
MFDGVQSPFVSLRFCRWISAGSKTNHVQVKTRRPVSQEAGRFCFYEFQIAPAIVLAHVSAFCLRFGLALGLQNLDGIAPMGCDLPPMPAVQAKWRTG